MTAGVADVERMQGIVARRVGLHFDDGKRALLAEILERHADLGGRGAADYLASLESSAATAEPWRSLLEDLTVTETYFLRNADQLRAFSELVLGARARTPSPTSLRILSAGCASGEEPYTLAILAHERLGEARAISIRGIDINVASLEKAARARYSAWSLRETSADIRARWFRTDARDFVVDPAVRAMVTLEHRNLADEDPAFWRSDAFDVVFCRNVIMYFAPDAARAAVARIARSLSPEGLLFLGHAETLRGLSTDFHLRHTHGTFYYQRKSPSDDAATDVGTAEHDGRIGRERALNAEVDFEGSWVDNIHRASERVRTLTANLQSRERSAGVARASANGGGPRYDVGSAVDLLRHERFSEARAMLHALPPESARDPDVLLLRAVLFTHGGDLAAAERVCTELLALDEMSAGAHYVVALCREGAGDRSGAVEHDQVATYLDPGFAMPRLHLGLMARRAGEHSTARRELGEALALLWREDASRLLLFGGGFAREALIALCRAELVACGGTP